MAGIPPIPPLLCDTPPPIDFGEEDDDSGLPPTLTLEDEDDYGDFALGTDINDDTTNAEVFSLPRTPQFELSSSTTSGFTDIPPAFEDCGALSLTSSEFNNSTENEEDKTQIQLNEAFNYNVTQTFSANGEDIQTTDALRELQHVNNCETTATQQNEADNKPLDFDFNETKVTKTTCAAQDQSLSVTENLAEISNKQDSKIEDINDVTNEQEQKIEVKSTFMPIISESPPPLTDLVLLEDLADDSSDEDCHRSPKKSPLSPTAPLADNVDNDSENFFAIHIVNTPPSPKEDKFSSIADDINMNNSLNHNNNITSDIPNTINANLNGPEGYDDDFGDFADFETACDFIKPPENSELVTSDSITSTVVDSNQNVKEFESPTDTAIPVDDNEYDFDDFQDFSSAPAPTPAVVPIISAPNALSITTENNKSNTQTEALKAGNTEPLRNKAESEANSFDNDDDDDFGDFEEASFDTPASPFTATASVLQTPTPAPTAATGNIGERLGTVLKMMFPTEEAHPADDDGMHATGKIVNNMNETLPFEAIEAAKALEFQWPQSEMRHALIRAIGIDSRNILFGDNWNPSMPRFAANLSFNPLKPMKPQTTNTVPNTNTTFADADSMQYSINSSASAAYADISSCAKKTDVPDVEFDWQGAGLVNPLDASHVHTLLLDLDQVMVMATKLDNLTVDSSSYSFSACATLEQIATTTTTTTITTINTTANNNLTNQMQRLNLTLQTTNTITTTPAWVASAPSSSLITARTSLSSTSSSSSQSPSPSPSLRNNNNSTIFANSTHIFHPNAKQHGTNTYANVRTPPKLETNALTCCETTHAIAGHNALHSLNTYDPLQTLAAHGPFGNINTVEPFLYLNNFTNHILAINQNHTPAMYNKNTYNNDKNNKLTLNTNSTKRFAMLNPKTTATSNATLKCDDICNDFNVLTEPLECVNFHSNSNRLRDCSRAKGATNTRKTEAIQPAAPVARLDTPDDEHQSHTTFSNVDDNISETLSENVNDLTASPNRDVCPSPLALDNAAYQFTAPEPGINTISSSTSASSISNSSSNKPYDNSKTMTTLRLGANIVVDADDDDETVVTSTYAGPLKETHIYTPSKTDVVTTVKTSKATPSGSEPIDFDYEIAAAGIIIDEKVVKKEYRDVEYNPGFSLEVVNEYAGELPISATGDLVSEPSITVLPVSQAIAQQQAAEFDNDEFTEFTEFQSVPPPLQAAPHIDVPLPVGTITSKFPAELNNKTAHNSLPAVLPAAVAKAKVASNTPSRTNSPSIIDNMILSPAILLPQAIPISANNTSTTKVTPTIEWGDATASINPDELARIEELFAQPKIPAAAKDVMTNVSQQKTSPLHNYAEKHTKNNSISISASVAMKEQDSTLNDDYWSEFVSVPVTPQLPNNASRLNNNNNNNNNSSNIINRTNRSNNNNQLVITPKRITDVHINSANNSNTVMRSSRHQQQTISVQRTLTPTPPQKSAAHASINISAKSNVYNSNTNSNSNDDDWSDFVSSTPTPASNYMPAAHAPQFNSAAWQNANFYNNPLGLYHQQAVMQTRTSPLTPQQQQLQLQQQIHIMQDFSTAPVANRPQIAMHNSNNANISNLQHSNTSYSPLQVGSARVAPSISLIPDLGFVAPALPVHTAFVNVLPKTSFNSKK